MTKGNSTTPKHLAKATGKSSNFVINKSSGALVKDDAPKVKHPTLHPYHGSGKKCC